MNVPKLEILTLGTELLIGLQTNHHLAYLGEELSRHGLPVRRNVVINDDAVSIGEEFLACWERANIVITTGGLGATSDDLTRECVAKALGLKLVHDPEIERAVEEFFRRRDLRMPEINRKIAQRPEGAEVLENRIGTAPGLWIERDGKIAILLPGPGAEMHDVFKEEVLPRLRKRGLVAEGDGYVQVRTAGLGETAVVEKLGDLFELVPGLEIGYAPHEGMVDVRLSAANGELSRQKLLGVAEQCARRLGADFVGLGHDTLEQAIFENLRNREMTVAVAESCTGGLLASRFADMAGISKVFVGGAVCYSNDAKVQMLNIPECLIDQHGAVSAEVAVAMATGVAERLGADFALSVTGYAGPDGGTEANPVGTVYLGLHTPEGAWARREQFPGGRLAVRKRAANVALDWLRRVLIFGDVPGMEGKVELEVEL